MAKYNKTMFYWLQLREDFFDEEAISWLEEQPNGKDYCLFYLKLCLKSLKTNGIMIRQVGQIYVPYDANKLAELTRTKVDTVVVALKLLKQIGLVNILENGEIYLPQVETMIGAKSVGAFIREQQRRLQGRQTDDKKATNVAQSVALEYRVENIDNRNNIHTHARTREEISIDFVLSECERLAPTLLKRYNKKPNAESTLKQILKDLDITKEDLSILLDKANKTYVVMPKYNTLDLCWVLNHREEVLKAEIKDNTNKTQKTHKQESQLERAAKSLGLNL